MNPILSDHFRDPGRIRHELVCDLTVSWDRPPLRTTEHRLFDFVREVCLHHLKSSYGPVCTYVDVALPRSSAPS